MLKFLEGQLEGAPQCVLQLGNKGLGKIYIFIFSSIFCGSLAMTPTHGLKSWPHDHSPKKTEKLVLTDKGYCKEVKTCCNHKNKVLIKRDEKEIVGHSAEDEYEWIEMSRSLSLQYYGIKFISSTVRRVDSFLSHICSSFSIPKGMKYLSSSTWTTSQKVLLTCITATTTVQLGRKIKHVLKFVNRSNK